MHTRTKTLLSMAAVGCMATSAFAQRGGDYPPFDKVSEGYERVVSTAEGKSFYNLYLDKSKNQLLAELPRGYERQKHYIAVTQNAGGIFAGLQGPAIYAYWKRYDNRLALIAPELDTQSKGEAESRSSVNRLFTDRVLLDVPIVTMGPSGQPVIDLDDLFLRQGAQLMGRGGRGLNARLARVTTAKAFPENIEVAIEAPDGSGSLVGFHYSISLLKKSPGYKPRVADERVGYFTTVYRDLGKYKQSEKWVRYINRWHLEKRDKGLKLSPPKEPIVYYIEHTVPVRYRRYVREGVLEWNNAFEKVGIDNAIEVRFQDKETGAYMDIDPEDVRYNFVRWLNNDISTAIGPSRAHPETGEILDADIVLTDGWIRAFWGWYHEQAPEFAVDGFTPETLEWLEQYPEWDPRLLLVSPERRREVLAERAARDARIAAGEMPADVYSDPALRQNAELAAMSEWLGGETRTCMAAHGMAFNMAFGAIALETMDMLPGGTEAFGPADAQILDGIPEWFIGPMLKELVCHEVGHTLGLRHNFKSSSIYDLDEINSEEHKGNLTIGGSVMDYLPPNFNFGGGEVQGDFSMINIGPYDYWAIEYGYTFGDTAEVLKRVAEPELVYLSDDDTGGPDPLARRYDFAKNPLDYANNQMRLVGHQREHIMERFVKDGDSWSNARRGYVTTLNMHMRMISMMSNWVGGAHVNRDRKGDPNGRRPVEVVDPAKQRAALEFVIENAFHDDAFGLSEELLAHMTVDKWTDNSEGDRSDPTWPIHANVSGVQQSALTMIMNPTTLSRVHDNEFRTPADQDAITLPEVMNAVCDDVFAEFGTALNGATFTNRKPMISSLRRNLQSNLLDRLVVLADGDARLPRPIRTLALSELRQLESTLGGLLEKAGSGQIDDYTVAHLEDMAERVDRALSAVRVSG